MINPSISMTSKSCKIMSSSASDENLNDSSSALLESDVKLPPTVPASLEPSSAMVFSRESEAKVMDSVIVNNEKVRYYYNKTLSLRSSLTESLDFLEKLHGTTFAYLAQLPETGDYSVIGTLFELIPTLAGLINWNSLNHTCYWEDFNRETKQLITLLEKVNGAALKCSDAASFILSEAQKLFKELGHGERNILKVDRAISYRQAADYINEDTAQNIQIHWKKPGDVITLSWHDPDGGLLKVALNNTGVGFRLRFLRHIIYHTRASLENTYLTFMKLCVIFHLRIPIEKLERCRDVDLRTLSLQEKTFLTKAKREFDSNLDNIWKMVSRFKYQTFNLMKYKKILKGLKKSQKYFAKTEPTFVTLKMTFDDSLLMRVMSLGIQAQTREESFDFTMFPDRTEDVISIVEELMSGGGSPGYQDLQLLLAIVKSSYSKEKDNFNEKEKQSTKDEIKLIFAHRFQIRRYLKKSVEVFEKHPAFHKMDNLKLLIPTKQTLKLEEPSSPATQESTINSDISIEGGDQTEKDQNNNELRSSSNNWITLEGGIKVTLDPLRGVMMQCPFTEKIKTYKDLNTDEKVITIIRVIRKLLVVVANEQCWAKICFERTCETKSLVKRLKQKDRENSSLQTVILDHNRQLRQMLQLTKSMRFLKKWRHF